MCEEKESKSEGWTEGAKNLGIDKIAKEIYDDGFKGGVQEIGKGITTLGKAINVALAPVRGVVWSFETIESLLKEKLEIKLKDVPPDKIQPPPINIAGPTIEALRFAGNEPDLQELFANLLASSMNKEMKGDTHPAFVEIIKQLSSKEAIVLNMLQEILNEIRNARTTNSLSFLFSESENDDEDFYDLNWEVIVSAHHYLDKLASEELFSNFRKKLKGNYKGLNDDFFLRKHFSNIIRLEILGVQSFTSRAPFEGNENYRVEMINSILFVTEFGKDFLNTCVELNNSTPDIKDN